MPPGGLGAPPGVWGARGARGARVARGGPQRWLGLYTSLYPSYILYKLTPPNTSLHANTSSAVAAFTLRFTASFSVRSTEGLKRVPSPRPLGPYFCTKPKPKTKNKQLPWLLRLLRLSGLLLLLLLLLLLRLALPNLRMVLPAAAPRPPSTETQNACPQNECSHLGGIATAAPVLSPSSAS